VLWPAGAGDPALSAGWVSGLEVSDDMTVQAVFVPPESVFRLVSKSGSCGFAQSSLREWSSIAKPVSHARPIA
jgi:hypothetical protein